ncbi:uncharacterized protein Z518_02826 [Rhinocladiella mackenziei CBS 650.93]|uniref:Wax synthase domain-containing protein n=1 Tax=Rhinocladiella mackenziei CBS 650.93 TaxID=1442369 RepID=A0A0D2JFT4_9EURO|nr:uncharacterized protein Z518_02826 [Rhinocladiella mackenziei CBS 650.93]KIX08170.1 hypothetical protein Z518_02826 [Rhinocladiella mackenziei CBS 650.93]
MDPKWFPPPNRALQSGGGSILAAHGIGTAALLLPQGRFRHVIVVPPLVWIAYNLRQHTTGKTSEDYLTAVHVCMGCLKWIDFSVLRVPEQSLRRVRADGSVETAEEIQNMTVWSKLRWLLDLQSTMRGIGWNWRVKNVDDVPPDISRSRFVLEQVIRAGYCFAYIDIHEWYIRRTPFGDGSSGPPDLFSIPIGEQIFWAWFRACHSGFTLVFGYYLLAAILVGCGLYRPQSWPPMFGSFIRKGYTMRNIWGYCWHQFLRRTLETYNSCLITLFGVKRGSLASRYLQLYNAFFISALIHHVGALNIPYSSSVWDQFIFFMMQPVAITIEDFAIYLGKRAGLKESWKTRAVGYAWVWCVLSYTLRFAIKSFMDVGLGSARHPFVEKFSIMDRVFG